MSVRVYNVPGKSMLVLTKNSVSQPNERMYATGVVPFGTALFYFSGGRL